jgi:hypothetical protein
LNTKLEISNDINIDECSSPDTAEGGGAMYLKIQENGSVELNGVTINKCSG